MPLILYRLAERITAKEQTDAMQRDIEEDRRCAAQLLQNQLDALLNFYYARQNFEARLQAARQRNEAARQKHSVLLQEFCRELVSRQYAEKRIETAQALGPEVVAHAKRMRELRQQLVRAEHVRGSIVSIMIGY